MAAENMLKKIGIILKTYSLGTRATTCSKCSQMRVKKNAKCLSVTIQSARALFCCPHCGWKGVVDVDRAPSYSARGARARRGIVSQAWTRKQRAAWP